MSWDDLPPIEALDSPPEPGPSVTAEQSASPPPFRRGKKAKLRQTVWSTLRNRPKVTFERPAGLLAFYTDCKKHGPLDSGSRLFKQCARPSDLRKTSPNVGDTVCKQVRDFVEEQPGFEAWLRGDISHSDFLSQIAPLFPRSFLKPWTGLCEAEIDEMNRDLAAEAATQDHADRDDGRLMRGMRRD